MSHLPNLPLNLDGLKGFPLPPNSLLLARSMPRPLVSVSGLFPLPTIPHTHPTLQLTSLPVPPQHLPACWNPAHRWPDLRATLSLPRDILQGTFCRESGDCRAEGTGAALSREKKGGDSGMLASLNVLKSFQKDSLGMEAVLIVCGEGTRGPGLGRGFSLGSPFRLFLPSFLN